MGKILSIAIPAYNMENYLRRCLDSLIASTEVLDRIEVIVVNDGSKDSTSTIAHEYAERFPKSIIVIDKKNGHYGSAINAALKIASGKYFKILDADDWYDSKVLSTVVNTIKNLEVDAVFTKKSTYNATTNTLKEQECHGGKWGRIINLHEEQVSLNMLSMHSFCFRTDFLRQINYRQTEGVCYTDTEYVYYPLSQANTLYCIDVSLYQYFLGRDEQSMAYVSMAKNYNHFNVILKRIVAEGDYKRNESSTLLYNHYIIVLIRFMLMVSLLLNPYNKDRDMEQRTIIKGIKDEILLNNILSIKIKKIPYVKIWYEGRWYSRPFLLILRKCFGLIARYKAVQN